MKRKVLKDFPVVWGFELVVTVPNLDFSINFMENVVEIEGSYKAPSSGEFIFKLPRIFYVDF